MEGCSIVLCCFNSAGRLPATLDALFRLDTGGKPLEIVLVDNNSTDLTSSIAIKLYYQRCARKETIKLNVVSEPKPGLTFARIKGASCAKYEVIVFCDDDNSLEKNYVLIAYKLMQNHSVGVVGAFGIPKLKFAPPKWFEINQSFYALGSQSPEVDNHVYGAGMVTRKTLFLKVYQSDIKFVCTDRGPYTLSSGGDTEYCYLICLLGLEVIYSPELRFYHLIPRERISIEYFKELKQGIGISYSKLIFYRYLLAKTNVTRWDLLKDLLYIYRKVVRNGLSNKHEYRKINQIQLIEHGKLFWSWKSAKNSFMKNLANLKS